MTRYIYILFLLILSSCGNSTSEKNNSENEFAKTDTTDVFYTLDSVENIVFKDSIDLTNLDYFIVVADTSQDYFKLRKKMFYLANLTESFSIENLNFYQNQANESTLALIAGIYETQKIADSALTVLQKTEKKAYQIKANIYTGCMH